MRISIFAKILQIAKIHEIYKGQLGGQVLKRPPFGQQCTDFARFFLKVTLLQTMKSQKLAKYLTYLKKIAIAHQKKCGS